MTETPAREPTQEEMVTARAWVAKHRWTHPMDAQVEYEHAVEILVFANQHRTAPLCAVCGHPADWHRQKIRRDPAGGPLTYFCVGYDSAIYGPESACDCPDLIVTALPAEPAPAKDGHCPPLPEDFNAVDPASKEVQP